MGGAAPRLLVCAAIGLAAVACGPQSRVNGDGGGGDDTGDDGTVIDGEPAPDSSSYPDATVYPDGGDCPPDFWVCTNPVDDGCPSTIAEICGNGSDDDCDTLIDEGCTCTPGAVQACFQGPPGQRGVGACVDGMQTCQGSPGDEFGVWGPCTGGITPMPEACDSQDNDCNGCADDNPACCTVNLACPGPGDLADGAPFTDYVIDGTMFFSGPVTSWSWTVTGGPCDQLFATNGAPVSYTLSGATTSMLTFHPTLSGDYTVTVTMTLPDGSTQQCTFIIHIAGPGLRVELCWDTVSMTDIDLHLHRPGTTTNWFNTPDDCHYGNCKATTFFGIADWGYANSPLAECVGGPEGLIWQTLGYCRNPRLDLDNISTYGAENINVDVPVTASTYRVMVHYYGGSQLTHPMVDIYCGGTLKATYGQAPDLLAGFTNGGGYNAGLMWRVVDVTPVVVGGVTTDCTLTPLHPPGMTTGYWLTNNVSTY
jgi:hypothetical protein